MAYETKVILMSLARTAARLASKEMYDEISALANVEGLVLKTFAQAREEMGLK